MPARFIRLLFLLAAVACSADGSGSSGCKTTLDCPVNTVCVEALDCGMANPAPLFPASCQNQCIPCGEVSGGRGPADGPSCPHPDGGMDPGKAVDGGVR